MKSFWNMQNDLLLFIINQITIVIHTPQLIYSKIIKTSMFFSFLLLEYSRNYIFEKYLRRVWRNFYLFASKLLKITLKILKKFLWIIFYWEYEDNRLLCSRGTCSSSILKNMHQFTIFSNITATIFKIFQIILINLLLINERGWDHLQSHSTYFKFNKKMHFIRKISDISCNIQISYYQLIIELAHSPLCYVLELNFRIVSMLTLHYIVQRVVC